MNIFLNQKILLGGRKIGTLTSPNIHGALTRILGERMLTERTVYQLLPTGGSVPIVCGKEVPAGSQILATTNIYKVIHNPSPIDISHLRLNDYSESIAFNSYVGVIDNYIKKFSVDNANLMSKLLFSDQKDNFIVSMKKAKIQDQSLDTLYSHMTVDLSNSKIFNEWLEHSKILHIPDISVHSGSYGGNIYLNTLRYPVFGLKQKYTDFISLLKSDFISVYEDTLLNSNPVEYYNTYKDFPLDYVPKDGKTSILKLDYRRKVLLLLEFLSFIYKKLSNDTLNKVGSSFFHLAFYDVVTNLINAKGSLIENLHPTDIIKVFNKYSFEGLAIRSLFASLNPQYIVVDHYDNVPYFPEFASFNRNITGNTQPSQIIDFANSSLSTNWNLNSSLYKKLFLIQVDSFCYNSNEIAYVYIGTPSDSNKTKFELYINNNGNYLLDEGIKFSSSSDLIALFKEGLNVTQVLPNIEENYTKATHGILVDNFIRKFSDMKELTTLSSEEVLDKDRLLYNCISNQSLEPLAEAKPVWSQLEYDQFISKYSEIISLTPDQIDQRLERILDKYVHSDLTLVSQFIENASELLKGIKSIDEGVSPDNVDKMISNFNEFSSSIENFHDEVHSDIDPSDHFDTARKMSILNFIPLLNHEVDIETSITDWLYTIKSLIKVGENDSLERKIQSAISFVESFSFNAEKTKEIVLDLLEKTVSHAAKSAVNAFSIIDDIYNLQILTKAPVSFGVPKFFIDPKNENLSYGFLSLPRDLIINWDYIVTSNGFVNNVALIKHSHLNNRNTQMYQITLPTDKVQEFIDLFRSIVNNNKLDHLSKVYSILLGVVSFVNPSFTPKEYATQFGLVMLQAGIASAAAFAGSKELISGAIAAAVAAATVFVANSAASAMFFQLRSNSPQWSSILGTNNDNLAVRDDIIVVINKANLLMHTKGWFSLMLSSLPAIMGISVALGSSAYVGFKLGQVAKTSRKKLRNMKIFRAYSKYGQPVKSIKLENGKTIKLTNSEIKQRTLQEKLSVPESLQQDFALIRKGQSSVGASSNLKDVKDALVNYVSNSKDEKLLNKILETSDDSASSIISLFKLVSALKNYDDTELQSRVKSLKLTMGDF